MIEDKVSELLTPVLGSMDIELIEVNWNSGALQLMIDQENGVTTRKLGEVNRLVGPLLEQHNVLSGSYSLEVTSPGLERPLRTIEHFRRAIGKEVEVRLIAPHRPRLIQGKVISAEEDSVIIEATELDSSICKEPEEKNIVIADIAKAKTLFDWRGALGKGDSDDKPRRKPRKSKK